MAEAFPASAPLLAAVALAVLPLPFLHAVWQRQTRRGDIPRRPLHLALLIAGGWALACLAATALPWAIALLAALAAVALAAWWWLQRATFGRVLGLPPGRLRPFERALWRNHLTLRERAQRHGPVFKLCPALEPFVAVVGHARGRALLRQHADRLRARPWGAAREVPGGFLRFMDGDVHRQLRQRVGTALRADLVDIHEAELRAIVRHGLARLGGGTAAAQKLVLRDITESSLALLLLGLGPRDPRLAALRATFPAPESADRTPVIGGCRAGGVAEGIRILLGEAQVVPDQPCVLARLADGARPDAAAVGNLILMLQIGGYDLASLYRWILFYLAGDPDVLRRQRELARTAEGIAHARACVLETLRLDQSEALLRVAADEIHLEGQRIPRGWGVRICLREAHRDPAAFERPDAFLPDRFMTDRPAPAEYAPFGLGAHTCIAAELSVELARLFVEELAAGYELRSDARPRAFGAYHWEPGAGFVALLEPLAGP